MTRINLVHAEELMDQHLFAEFREIKMIPKSLARSLHAQRFHADPVAAVLARVPRAFTLNTGHVSFFYDKGTYIYWRFAAIKIALEDRGVNFDPTSELDPDKVFDRDIRLRGDYNPTPEALEIIRARIAEKIAMKPTWYRYYGVPAAQTFPYGDQRVTPASFSHSVASQTILGN